MKTRTTIKTAAAVTAAVMLAAQAAYAYDIETDMDSFKMTVSLKSDTYTERPTIQVLDSGKTEVIYMGEGTSSENGDDTYTFEFETFSLPADLESGDYVIRIGGSGVPAKETTVAFVNINDKGAALNAVNAAADKAAAVAENGANLGVDTSALDGLDSEWKAVINKALDGVDLSNDFSEEQVNEKYDIFLEAYMPAAEKAVIAGSGDAAAVNAAIEASEHLGLDKNGRYSTLSDKRAVGEVIASRALEPDITDDELRDEFDGAVLVCVISQLDHGSAREAFEESIDAGLTDADMSDFNKLSETNKANVFKDLKKQGITDYEKLPDAFEETVSKYRKTVSAGGGGGGGTGGGSSSGGGGGTVTNPVLPGDITPQATASPAPQGKPQDFTDMDGFGWAEEAVDELSARGVLSGDGSGRFNPQNYITREEFAKIIVTAFDLYDSTAAAAFDDVPADAWFCGYVASAKASGVVTGISETEFGAGQNITRQDMAVMLKRVLDMTGKASAAPAAEFSDAGDIADYAKEAVGALSAAGILNGMEDGRFAPRENVTRAQSAKAVYELIKLIEG